jgi:predicted kinase
MSEPIFTMLIGLPGSGKSTYAKWWIRKFGGVIHSSDAIREELSGDENNQNINQKVFSLLHKRVKEDLDAGINVIYDATNVSSKRRKSFLREIKADCVKRAVVIATPYEVCIQQNENRERVVPEDVINRMYRNFEVPYYFEGWDEVDIFYHRDNFKSCYGDPEDFIFEVMDFSQDNSHHQHTLGMHCVNVRNYIKDVLEKRTSDTPNDKELLVAALIHDCGKPFTKTFENKKGIVSEEAHYYDHDKVGSYNSLFYNMSEDIDRVYVAALIQYHMIMHFMDNWKEKTVEKYTKMFEDMPDNFWYNLKLLNEADKNAH